ncbi:MAG TPA: uroporphyrinogen-III synthase [Polyangiaceae bacterium]|nr:uroporphyrinogen-III synthase [Polyangiaceae bacterium]
MRDVRRLEGYTIALPESRELDLLARIVEDLGGSAYRCPFVSIADTPDAEPVVAWLRQLVSGAFDDILFSTGEGVARLVRFAEAAGMKEEVLAAFATVRTVCRGPKPVRALRMLGLRPVLVADQPTTDGVIAALSRAPLAGKRVGVQLFGEDPNEKLTAFLQSAGALVHTVAPYVYVPGPNEPLLELIAKMAEGATTAIAFTSSSQVHRLWDAATSERVVDELEVGIKRTWVAAVGPIVAATLEAKGARVDVVPERSFFMRPLVNDLANFLAVAHPPSRSPSLPVARSSQ